MAPPKKLLVLGGTGFVGREVCRRAVSLGFDVTSLSRRGRILADNLNKDDIIWEKKVHWKLGSAFDKTAMIPVIAQADAVIHCVGIMFESSLNIYVSGSSSNPQGESYETENMESGLIPLSILEAQNAHMKPFAFVSASHAPPFLKRYLTTKLAVEKRMKELEEQRVIRSMIFRPGVIYHHSKWSSLPIAKMATMAHTMDGILTNKLGLTIGFPEPTPLDLLSTAILRAVARDEVHGVFNNNDMWALTDPEKPEI